MSINNEILIGIYIGFGIIAIAVIKLLPEHIRYRLPYRRKKFILSEAEKCFFQTLREVAADTYDIYPQISLSKLLYVDGAGGHWQSFWNKIDRKSVDFLLCYKHTSEPVLAIELDDASHGLPIRIARDEFVENSLKSAGFPLLRVRPQRVYDKIWLDKVIKDYINSKNSIKKV